MIGEKDALEVHVTTCEPGGEIVGLIVGVVLLEFDGEEWDEDIDLGRSGIEKRQS